MASYVENFKSYTDWGTVIKRSNQTPLDMSSIFGSYEDAQKYAKGDGSDKNKLGKTSYVGQTISVHENGKVDIYQIMEDRTLRKVANEERLISQDGSIYDCENGVLTLKTINEENSITIQLDSNYGTF